MKPTGGFEPPTPALRERCSGQLSYVGSRSGSLAGGETASQSAYGCMGRLDRLPRKVLEDGLVVHEATTLRARLLGLAFMRPPPAHHALLIPHCRSVHTFGMRFPIDVTFLDDRGRPLRHERAVPPRRVLVERRAFAVLETPAGDIARSVEGRSESAR
jgi:uncharacterized membrane protein (UPF0127 family)